nr:MAG TPA: hypothetical protein [Caudoviricetes sp.]
MLIIRLLILSTQKLEGFYRCVGDMGGTWGRKTMKNTTNHTHRLKLPPKVRPENESIPY